VLVTAEDVIWQLYNGAGSVDDGPSEDHVQGSWYVVINWAFHLSLVVWSSGM
jgi:hypothetical protein